MFKSKLVIIAFLLIAVLSIDNVEAQYVMKPSGSAWLKDGKPIPDKPEAKSKDGFGAILLVTNDESFFDRWNKPEDGNGVDFGPENARAQRGDKVFPIILFAESKSKDEQCNVSYDMEILKPNGEVYGSFKDLKTCLDHKIVEGMLAMAEAQITIKIEPEDPTGFYKVSAVVKNNTKGTSLTLTKQFEVK